MREVSQRCMLCDGARQIGVGSPQERDLAWFRGVIALGGWGCRTRDVWIAHERGGVVYYAYSIGDRVNADWHELANRTPGGGASPLEPVGHVRGPVTTWSLS